jgi:hypothetical protein
MRPPAADNRSRGSAASAISRKRLTGEKELVVMRVSFCLAGLSAGAAVDDDRQAGSLYPPVPGSAVIPCIPSV